MTTTFYFNTGVRMGKNPGLHERAITQKALDDGLPIYLIPFKCKDVPKGYDFIGASDYKEAFKGVAVIRREIIQPSYMMSKYAFFKENKLSRIRT